MIHCHAYSSIPHSVGDLGFSSIWYVLLQHFHRCVLYTKLQYFVILSFSLPACILLLGYGQPVYAFSEQNPCLPEFKNALEQLERGENAQLLMKVQQSASLGNGVGLSCLAELYLEGWGAEGDVEKAWELFQQAAQKGNAAAMHRIGTMYELGIYVDKDYTWAMLWHLRSAVRGYADAQTAAGILYEDGLAGYSDITAALFWYEKAAAQSEPFAVEAVQRLRKMKNDVEEQQVKQSVQLRPHR